MKIVASATTALLATVFFAQPALAEGDIEAGRAIAYSCQGCHGIEGYRNAYPSFRVPRLGGQMAGYLALALRGYRDSMREHPTMVGQAASLSDQEIDDVAAYFASIATETVAAGGSDTAVPDVASTCTACHGPAGISINAMWPTLAGQHQDYLEHTLRQYRDGTRNDPVMMPLAAALTDDDIEALAEYYAGLDGLETTLPE